MITASDDKNIMKSNFTNKELIFILVGHTYHINSIEYDFGKDKIMSTSQDNSLKVWYCAK